MARITIKNGWVKEWEAPGTFTVTFDAETEDERRLMFELMRSRKSLKVTLEEVD